MYKTILVHVDGNADHRIAVAAQLALRHDAHLIGVALTGIAPFVIPVGAPEPGLAAATFPFEQLQAEADSALDAFEAAARADGVASIERRRVDDAVGPGLAAQARYADLVVLGRGARRGLQPMLAQVPAQVVLGGGRPVLLLPAAAAPAPSPASNPAPRRILVAWNGTINAVRAIGGALPLLCSAEIVQLAVINPLEEPGLHGPEPGSDMALYLARHGARVEVCTSDGADSPAQALLELAARHASELIVMGAYGRSRFSELVLGGVTRELLRASPLPLLLAH